MAQIFTIECIPCAKTNIFSEDCLEMMFSVGKIELKVKEGCRKKIFGAQAPLLVYLLLVIIQPNFHSQSLHSSWTIGLHFPVF